MTGLDFNAVESCLNIVAAALVERGGEIEQIEVKYPSENNSSKYGTYNSQNR